MPRYYAKRIARYICGTHTNDWQTVRNADVYQIHLSIESGFDYFLQLGD